MKVDAGMPGNCHDATPLQASNIWQHLPTLPTLTMAGSVVGKYCNAFSEYRLYELKQKQNRTE